jgi:hypothetical protein
MHPVYHAAYEQAVAAARAQLDEESFAAAWAAGQVLPLEQAILESVSLSFLTPATVS